MYVYHNFLIHSSADGQLGGFHVLAVVNSAAVNTGVHVSSLCILTDELQNHHEVWKLVGTVLDLSMYS